MMNKNLLQCIMILMLSHSVSWGMEDDQPNFFPTKLPLDQFVEVLSYCNEERDWARLRMVCTWFKQNLSIKNPSLDIIQHKAFRTGQENVQSLAFNAAWNNNFDGLKALIKHMQQIDYKYTYSIPYMQPFSHFDLLSIIKVKMSNLQQIAISNEVRKNKCELEFYNYHVKDCDAMIMACYNRKSDALKKYNLPDIGDLEWRHLLGIAIGRDANQCIDLLCTRTMKKDTIDLDKEFEDNEYYQAMANQVKQGKAGLFFQILRMTMQLDKCDAFEIIVKNDPFDCLNFVYEHSEKVATRKTILDKLILFSKGKPEQTKYIDIYRKYGGKTNKELEPQKEKCIIS